MLGRVSIWTRRVYDMETVHKKKKVDISGNVTGQVKDGRMMLILGERQIGSLSLDESSKNHFEEGYGIEDQKIYQIQEDGVQQDHYVEGCDMGWC